MNIFNCNRSHKIIGSVQSTSALLSSERMQSVLEIKASTYDLSLRNKHLLEKYSSVYNISKNVADYLFIPVPIFIVRIPNKNGIAFVPDEIHVFYTDIGQYAYQTWVGKPCFVEHRDENPLESVGMIFDSVMRPLTGYSIPLEQCWVLWGLDRTKDLNLTSKIQSSKSNHFSMGARASGFKCSVCNTEFQKINEKDTNGNITQTSKPSCRCFVQWPRMNAQNNQLSCANAINIVGEEVSYVADPAWVSAESTTIMETKQ